MYDLKILVPFSASPSSEEAVKKAIAMADGIDAMISCLYVMDGPSFHSGLQNLQPEEKAHIRNMEISVSASLNSIFSAHGSTPFELIITGGEVAERIIEKAGQLDVDIIIMGRYDTETESTTRFGSNTRKVMDALDLPVHSVLKAQQQLINHA